MNLEAFRQSIEAGSAPQGMAPELQALWHEARGDWSGAHGIVQGLKGSSAAAVHAYLHRREGDAANADYWYGKAGRPRCRETLDREWELLVLSLLEER